MLKYVKGVVSKARGSFGGAVEEGSEDLLEVKRVELESRLWWEEEVEEGVDDEEEEEEVEVEDNDRFINFVW